MRKWDSSRDRRVVAVLRSRKNAAQIFPFPELSG